MGHTIAMQQNVHNVVVTGGAQRIGRVICEQLAARGVNVAVHYNESGDEAEALCTVLQSRGVRAISLRADLRVEADCRQLMEEAAERLGGLDGLVNNAAVFQPDSLRTFSMDRLLEQMQVNTAAPLLLTQLFAKMHPWGVIVNLLDQRIARSDAAGLSYTLSKQALAAATQMLAVELAPAFRVNAVAPGAVLTPSHVCGEKKGAALLADCGTPAAVAEAVVYLLFSTSITGQVLFVDGGQHLLAVR